MGGTDFWRSVSLLAAFGGLSLGAAAASDVTVAALQAAGAHVDATGRVQIDVHFDCALALSANAEANALAAAGLAAASSVKLGTLCVVEGWTAPANLPRIAGAPGVTRITAPSYVKPTPPRAFAPVARALEHAPTARQSGAGLAIDQNGVAIVRADKFVTQTGVDGAGVTVGVQSSGVYNLNVIQQRGELPSAISVLYPAGNTSSVAADEGTVLLEEIHAVAPGAKLLYCGPATFVDFTSCMSQLINAGATILVDDTGFAGDGLLTQNNDQTSAIAQILAQSPAVTMLSSAGNNNGTYWEGDYSPVSASTTTLPALSCPAGAGTPDAYVAGFGTATSQTLTIIGSGANFPLLLAWADPPTQITSTFDVYWFVAGDPTPLGCFTTAGNTTNQIVQQLTLPAGAYTVVVASPDPAASGKFLKLWAGGDGLTSLSVSTSGGLVSPQAMVSGLLTIGAVNGSDGVGDTIESFSSTGPLTVQFPAPARLQAPTLVAPDGIVVDAAGTFFESDLFPDGNFYGTSAAVPNAAGVAALIASAFPGLSVAQLTTALQSGATALASPEPDYTFGYGRVDAMGALAALPAPTISALSNQSSTDSASTPSQPLVVTGTGTLKFTVSSSNTALVPSAIVAAGSPGVTLTAGCGSTTLSCSVYVTPVPGQAGTATLAISVLDGANRSAIARTTLTAAQPAPATNSTSGGTGSSAGSGGGGGALGGGSLLWLAGLSAWAKRRR